MSLDQILMLPPGYGFDNSAPRIVVPSSQNAVSNVALAITGTSIADADGNTQTVTLTASHGTLTLASTAGLLFSAGDGTSDATMTFSGSLANINTALATITYTSTTDYSGSDTLTVNSTDSAGGVATQKTVSITVTWTPLSTTWDSFVDYDGVQTYSDAGTTLITNGGAIYQSNDYSGNTRHHVQTTLGNRAIYGVGANGKGFATFNGSKYYNSLTIPGSSGIFVFGIVKFTALGYHNIIDRASANPMVWVDGSGRLEVNAATAVSTVKNDGNWHSFCLFTAQGSTRTVLWVDGSLVNDLASAGTVTNAVVSLFNRGGSSRFNGSCTCLGFRSGGYSSHSGLVSLLETWATSRKPT